MTREQRSVRHRMQAVTATTGVSAATLRSWERRYGVPSPQRTPSAYRLYSAADIDIIVQMRDLVRSGVPASEAARRITALGHPALGDHDVFDPFEQAAQRITMAVEAFDASAIDEALRAALGLGAAAAVYERAIRPALIRIGDLWQEGRIGIAQEHAASHLIETVLRDTLRLVQPVDARRTVVLCCVAEEQHTMGLYGVGLRFAGWSYRVAMLGARTPPAAVGEAVARLRPDLIGLSSTMPLERSLAHKLFASYGEACAPTPWVVGGAQAPSLRSLVEKAGGVVVTGSDPATWRARIEHALRHGREAAV